MKTLKRTAVLLFVITGFYATAQTFNYNFTQSTNSYTALTEATTVDTSLTADRLYNLPIGFSFTYLGNSFENISLSTNGKIKFNNDANYTLSVFDNLFTLIDSMGHSKITYATVESGGGKIFKIQYNHFAYGMSAPGEYINFQVWLYEQSNKIEIHTGPTNINLLPNPLKPTIGLINNAQSTTPWAFVLNGEATEAEPMSLTEATASANLNNLPAEGTVYEFTVAE